MVVLRFCSFLVAGFCFSTCGLYLAFFFLKKKKKILSPFQLRMEPFKKKLEEAKAKAPAEQAEVTFRTSSRKKELQPNKISQFFILQGEKEKTPEEVQVKLQIYFFITTFFFQTPLS